MVASKLSYNPQIERLKLGTKITINEVHPQFNRESYDRSSSNYQR